MLESINVRIVFSFEKTILFIINLFCKLIFSKHPCFIFCLFNVFLVMRILRIFRFKFINKKEMLKVLTFMRQVANGLQMEGNFGTAYER